MAKFQTVALTALKKQENLSPQARRQAVLQRQLGGGFTGWKPVEVRVVPKGSRGDKSHMLKCDATHGKGWKLVVVTNGTLTRQVGFGFAKKYLGIDLNPPE